MSKVETAQTCDGQWVACYSDSAYPNVKRPTKGEAIEALKAKAHA